MRDIICVLAVLMMSNAAVSAESYKVEKISSGYQFTEGPVWAPWNALLFSDTPSNKIFEIGGEAKVYKTPSENSNGLTFDSEGRLIVCEHGARRVTRTEKNGLTVVLADKYEGKRLNSPNDIVVKSDGTIYFTDPSYGVDEKSKELDFKGVYRIKTDGTLELLIKDFDMPNGLCFSPDESKLYIADSSNRRHIRVFEVGKNGTLSGGEVFAKVADNGVPDGIKVDTEGKLYAAGPNGVWIFDTTGKHIDTIPVPETPANIAWGDKDGKTLYITARTGIYKVKLKVGGKPPR